MTLRTVLTILGTAAIAAAVFGMSRASVQRTVPTAVDGDPAAIEIPSSTTASMQLSRPIDTSVFVDPDRFHAAWTSLKGPDVPRSRVIAGVVNHHVLASDLLARFFRGLKAARPDATRFIILTPDHYGAGRSDISTHERPYRVGNGLIPIDTTSTGNLIAQGIAVAEDGAMYEREHGIGALIPFLAHEYPDATVVPLSVRGTADRTRVRALGMRLAPLVDTHTVVIVSSDMSHYLDERTAKAHDVTTMSWLSSLDGQRLSGADDGYLDNGASVVALIRMFGAMSVKPAFTVIDHAISSDYGGPRDDTTSYINGFWSF